MLFFNQMLLTRTPTSPKLAWRSGLRLRRVFPVWLDGAAHQQFGAVDLRANLGLLHG